MVIKNMIKMKHAKKKKSIKILLYGLLSVFILMNFIAVFHSYKFTHFTGKETGQRTGSPGKLSFGKKLSTVLLGVNNPKPKSDTKPPESYLVKKLKSNVELEIWENKIPNSKGVVLLFHGYSAEKSSLLKNAEFFNQSGYSTILTDFMGCGNSEGNQTTIGYFEAENVKTVYQYAEKSYSNIILYGSSMGSASIVRAVSKFNINPNKIIIECPFSSMEQTVENRFENMKIPSFPMSYFLTFWGGTINGFWAFSHNPSEYSKNIKQPVLLMYGAKDKNVKREEIDDIYKYIASQNKTLKIFNQAGHENYFINFSEEWKKSVLTFLIAPD